LSVETGSKTHSLLLQINVQLQNEAALMSCRILAIEHRKCAAELSGSCNSSIMLQNFVMQPMRSALALISHCRQNKDHCFG